MDVTRPLTALVSPLGPLGHLSRQAHYPTTRLRLGFLHYTLLTLGLVGPQPLPSCICIPATAALFLPLDIEYLSWLFIPRGLRLIVSHYLLIFRLHDLIYETGFDCSRHYYWTALPEVRHWYWQDVKQPTERHMGRGMLFTSTYHIIANLDRVYEE
jgi:hypothetical protein